MQNQEKFPFIGVKLKREQRVKIIMSGIIKKGPFYSRKRQKLKTDLLNFHYEIIDYLMVCKKFKDIEDLENQIKKWIEFDETAKQYNNPIKYKIGKGKEYNKALLKKYETINEKFEVIA